uniref:Uncharacterized protein n=1 Tax=Eutreptiella gymnastica TaxID=73025 RepID=A0A7S4G2H1_9EUGL
MKRVGRERSEGSVPALLCMSCLLLTMTSILVAPVVLLIRRLDHGAPSLGIIFIPIFVILGSLSCCCFLQSMCLWLKVQEMMNKSENGSEPSSTPPNSAPHTPSAGAHAEQTAPGEPEVVIPTGTILVPPVTIPCAVQPASEPSAAEGID